MNYDVIVVGLGTAGCIAAVAAGRCGASVLALEKGTYPGGLQTGGFIQEYFLQKPLGIAEELELKAQKLFEQSGDFAVVTEAKKYVLEQAMLEAGCKICYGNRLVSVIKKGKRVVGIVRFEQGVEFQEFANTIIDSTADAFVAMLADCSLSYGRALDHRIQHSAVLFLCRERKNGKDVYCGNNNAFRENPNSISAFSKRMLQALAWCLKENHFQKRIATFSEQPGIREGARIIPRTPLTINDFLLNSSEKDIIAYAETSFDTCVTDLAFESEGYLDAALIAEIRGERFCFPIAMQNIFPREVDGLVVAGRNIGLDYDMGKAVRMNAAMSWIGESAGILAALAGKKGIIPNQISYEELSPLLQLTKPEVQNPLSLQPLSDRELEQRLNSNIPGDAIWSAYRYRKNAFLKKFFVKAAVPGKIYAAFALALLRERMVLPFLRNILEESLEARDEFAEYGYKAVYLIGRFHDKEAIPILKKILLHAVAEPDFDYHTYRNPEEVKYLYHSHSLLALMKIGQAHSECRIAVASILSCYIKRNIPLRNRFFSWNPTCLVRMEQPLQELIRKTLKRWKMEKTNN